MGRMRVGLGELYIVADGMGGHKGGALAAQLTVEGLCYHLNKASAEARIRATLQQAFEATNKSVYDKARSGDPETQGMGSTAVLLLIAGRTAHVAHVGDSRAYLYRNGRLRRLTTDHTRAQKMVNAGILTSEEARDHPSASVLDRAIGIKPAVEIDMMKPLPLKKGDGLLLCTDGLSGCVADSEIEAVLRDASTIQEIPKCLFDLALRKKSNDNVTVQFLQYGERIQARASGARLLYWIAAAAIGAALLIGFWKAYDFFLQYRAAKLTQAPAIRQKRTASDKEQEIEKSLGKARDKPAGAY
jgi:protein phosphatase